MAEIHSPTVERRLGLAKWLTAASGASGVLLLIWGALAASEATLPGALYPIDQMTQKLKGSLFLIVPMLIMLLVVVFQWYASDRLLEGRRWLNRWTVVICSLLALLISLGVALWLRDVLSSPM